MEEQGNENQEYPKQEVPRWQSQGMDNIPSFSPPENEYGAPQQRGGKFGSIGTIVITVIISLVLCYAMVSLLGISPSMKQYKADITRLELDLVDVRAVDTAINAELDGLQNASIIAQNASTTATEAKELVNTLQADYASLNNSLEALQARVTTLESNSGDIYNDTEVRGLITALQTSIGSINTNITALSYYDVEHTITIKDKITALQALIDSINTNMGIDITKGTLQKQINDINSSISGIGSFFTGDKNTTSSLNWIKDRINKLDGRLNNVEEYLSIGNIENNAVVTKFNANYCVIKPLTADNYAIIVTLYTDTTVDITTAVGAMTTSGCKLSKRYIYGSPNMVVAVLTPNIISNAWKLTDELTLEYSEIDDVLYIEISTAIY